MGSGKGRVKNIAGEQNRIGRVSVKSSSAAHNIYESDNKYERKHKVNTKHAQTINGRFVAIAGSNRRDDENIWLQTWPAFPHQPLGGYRCCRCHLANVLKLSVNFIVFVFAR